MPHLSKSEYDRGLVMTKSDLKSITKSINSSPRIWRRHPFRENCATTKQDGKEVVVLFLNRARRDHYVHESRRVRKQWLSQF